VSSPARTLLDLATTVQPGALERALDDALRRRLLAPDDLAAELAAHRGSGLRGVPALRRLSAQRLDRPGIGESPWEDEVFTWIVEDGLPVPVRQHLVIVAGVPRRLDLAYPPWKIALEFQSWEYHRQRSRLDRDSERTTELALAGWLVLLVTSAHRRASVLGRIRRAIVLRQQEGLAS
jgi:hypothetical protein